MMGFLIMGFFFLVIVLFTIWVSRIFNGYYDIENNELFDTIKDNRSGKVEYIHKITYDDGHVKYKKYKI